MGRDEGWLAEHMLILKITSPEGKVYHVAGAFPSACGKTNLAMLEPTIPGWKVETIGDDIAWMRFGADGRLYAVNPEYGLFGVAPGHRLEDQRQRHAHAGPGQLGLHQRRPHRRRRHLVGGHGRAAGAPDRLEGQRLDAGERGASPRTRTAGSAPRSPSARSWPTSTTTPTACRSTRSCSAAAVRTPSRWSPRPGTGCTASTWAPRSPRRPPPPRPARSAWCAATRWPCCRSSATTPVTTSGHWIEMGKGTDGDAAKLPKIYYVNWFRKDADGSFLWPGFGENSRVLKWVVERIEGTRRRGRDPDRHGPDAGRAGRRGPRHDPGGRPDRPQGRPRGVAQRAAADHRVVREVRRQAARRALGRAGRAARPARRRAAADGDRCDRSPVPGNTGCHEDGRRDPAGPAAVRRPGAHHPARADRGGHRRGRAAQLVVRPGAGVRPGGTHRLGDAALVGLPGADRARQPGADRWPGRSG